MIRHTGQLLAFAALVLMGPAPAGARGRPAPRRAAPPKVVPPKLTKWVAAPYPEAARKAGKQGVVVLHVLVKVDGSVGEVKIVKSVDKLLDEAAVAAAYKFRFAPATVNGKPFQARIRIGYPFRLRRAPPPRRPARPGLRPPPRRPPAPRPPRRPVRATAPELLGQLRGKVREKGTRTPLDGAQLLFFKLAAGKAPKRLVKRAYADVKGKFEVTGLVPGRYEVIVRAEGCYPFKVKERLKPGIRIKVEYFVEREKPRAFETIVRGKADRKEVSRHTIVLESITKIPGTQGDALRAVQNMPGIARAPFGGGLLVVRGAAPADTRVFIEGHEIPQLYHFFGLTSVFNSDILKSIDFIPGNFSVRYGRATGGIIDVFTRKPKRDRWHGYLDVDLWDIGALVEGPLGKGSLALSLRRSHIDAILAALPKDSIGLDFTLAPAYYDYQAILDYPVGKGNLKLLIFGSDDRVKLVFDTPQGFDAAARRVKATIFFHKFILLWGQKWGVNEAKLSLSGGYFRNATFISEDLRLRFDWGAFTWRGEFGRKVLPNLKVSVGFVGETSIAHARFVLPQIPREGEVPDPIASQERVTDSGTEFLLNQAFWLEATWKPIEWLTIIPGLRADIFKFLTVQRVVFDPRLTARFDLYKKKVSLSVGVGLFHQEPQVFEVVDFIGGNPRVRHERTIHASMGLRWKIIPTVTLETTVFYKHLFDHIALSNQLVVRDGDVVRENLANHGVGRIYGAEFSIKAKPSTRCPKVLKLIKCFGWLTYTVLRSERRDEPGSRWRLFDFDQTHILTFIISGEWRHGWSLGIRFRLASGNPTTLLGPGIYDSDADTYIPVPGRINGFRMPLFHQLDIRIDKKWVFKRWILTLYLDIQNVYNHQAKEILTYNYNYTERGFFKGLPIIPSIGIKGAF